MRRILLLAILAACSEPAAPEPEGPRIVSLLPAFTEVLVELGAADEIVGCTEHCRPGGTPERLAWKGIRAVEGIVRSRPSLVIRQRPRRADDPMHMALTRAGLTVLSLPSETIEDVRESILRIGEAIGATARATAFRDRFDAELKEARKGAEGRIQPTVLFVTGRDPGAAANIHAAGPGSFLDELIRIAGARNVMHDAGSAYPAVSLESVVRRAPQVIIDNLPPDEDAVAAWQKLKSVPAVRDGRVHVVRDDLLLIPGPRLPRAVRRLVEIIHGRP